MEPATLEQLHESYAGALYVYAVRRLGDRQAAEELVQDTLVRAWRAPGGYDPARGSVAGWLFTIAHNLVIDRYRARDARPRTVGEPSDEVALSDGDIDRAIETWQLADALAAISADHREAIVLVHYEGLTVREAADRLGVPEGTVKSRVYYGLRALRLHLQETGVMA